MKTKTIIPAKIVEINSNTIVLLCLIDSDNKKYETRFFEITPFRDAIELTPGNHLDIIVTTKPGKRIFEYKNGSEKFIEPNPSIDYFSHFKGNSFFPPREEL